MTTERRGEQSRAIQEYKGQPNEPSKPAEPTRWQRFLAWFIPEVREKVLLADELAERYAEAEVARVEAGAKRANADAREAAAKAAEVAARVDHERAESVRAFCDLIDDQIARGSPRLGNELKLAQLLKTYPELPKQLKRIKKLREQLHNEDGVTIQVIAGELPARQTVPDEDDAAEA
jgi:hypothetical protein